MVTTVVTLMFEELFSEVDESMIIDSCEIKVLFGSAQTPSAKCAARAKQLEKVTGLLTSS